MFSAKEGAHRALGGQEISATELSGKIDQVVMAWKRAKNDRNGNLAARMLFKVRELVGNPDLQENDLEALCEGLAQEGKAVQDVAKRGAGAQMPRNTGARRFGGGISHDTRLKRAEQKEVKQGKTLRLDRERAAAARRSEVERFEALAAAKQAKKVS